MLAQIYVIEDHSTMQEAICEFISLLPDMRICGSANTACEALAQLPSAKADLVLTSINLPDMTGIDFLKRFQLAQPMLPCLVLSAYPETTYVQQALIAGARGCLLKYEFAELEKAIRHILIGGIYLSAQIHERLATQPQHLPALVSAALRLSSVRPS